MELLYRLNHKVLIHMAPNNRIEFALARPTRKSDALLLAAQPGH